MQTPTPSTILQVWQWYLPKISQVSFERQRLDAHKLRWFPSQRSEIPGWNSEHKLEILTSVDSWILSVWWWRYRVYYRENLHPIQNTIVLGRCHNCSYSEVHAQNKFPRHQMYVLRIANFSNKELDGSWCQTTWREEMVTHCSNTKWLTRKRNSNKNSDTKNKGHILTAFFHHPTALKVLL